MEVVAVACVLYIVVVELVGGGVMNVTQNPEADGYELRLDAAPV